jgi:DNA (cytosine-5)-methyltransferase 1
MKSPRKNTEAMALRKLRTDAGLSQQDLAKAVGYDARSVKRWEAGEIRPRPTVLEFLKALPANRPRAQPPEADFTFVDLFAGIGGLRLGFESAGGRCVFTSEWDPYCQKTYKANFGDEEIHGNIVNIAASSIPDHDVLLAGFPCQPFSIAGVSKKNALGRPHGFDCDTQGTLFFEVERILREKRPKAFLLENVKHLVNHDAGRTYRVILDVLIDKLGYSVFPTLVNARCVVPQHRERILIAGFREGVDFTWDSVHWPQRSEWPLLESVLHPQDGSEAPDPAYIDSKGRVLPKYTLTDHLWAYLRAYSEKHRAKGNGFGFGLVGPKDIARTLSARYYKDGSEILVKQRGRNPRRLTPRECARLMGFDSGARKFAIPVSDTQAYKQFGNSVAVPAIEIAARAMRPYITGESAPVQQLAFELSGVSGVPA